MKKDGNTTANVLLFVVVLSFLISSITVMSLDYLENINDYIIPDAIIQVKFILNIGGIYV